MVEQLTLNQRVVGSSPTRFTIYFFLDEAFVAVFFPAFSWRGFAV
jgi:hypothetical protein